VGTSDSALKSAVLGRNPKRTLARIAALLLVSYVAFGWLFLPLRGEGISMLPTFGDGQIGFVSTLAYNLTSPRRGDIVGIRMAGRGVMYVKRIVGLPGERIRIARTVVYVNDRPLDEPYAARGPQWDLKEIELGAGEYFVIGDNRRMRIEDHDLGIAARRRIVGKMLF
jgi:signal peptidase I